MTGERRPPVFERSYPGASPQLLARVRQNWSALGLDLDLVWREATCAAPGFAGVAPAAAPDSRPVDVLLLFDQGFLWIDALRREIGPLSADAAPLTGEQASGLCAVAGRLCDEAAAVRMLALSGLTTPAMQVSRSVSEDVDLALAILARRRIAVEFAACRTPEDAASFWRRRMAGGRAFQVVAQALYEHGLDRADDGDYARWRRDALAFLGAAVHGSAVGRRGARDGDQQPVLEECLYFATVRLQELSAYALVLGRDLRASLARREPTTRGEAQRLGFLLRGGDILIDQMRWLNGPGEP